MDGFPAWVQASFGAMAFIQFLMLVFIVPIRGALERQKESEDKLREDFNAWRVHVASEYIRRDEVASYHREVLSAIQRLESQIGALQREKADK